MSFYKASPLRAELMRFKARIACPEALALLFVSRWSWAVSTNTHVHTPAVHRSILSQQSSFRIKDVRLENAHI